MRPRFWRVAMMKGYTPLVAAASFAAVFVMAMTAGALFLIGDSGATSGVSFKLSHSMLFIRASSLTASGELEANANHLQDVVAAVAAASSAASFQEEEQELSDILFHKAKFAMYGSHAAVSSASPQHYSARSLGAQPGDRQYFVHISTRSDVRTLVTLQRFTGCRVIAHVQGGLYVVIGGAGLAAKARLFPGVSWVQERGAGSKIGSSLQRRLQEADASAKVQAAVDSHSSGGGAIQVVAECWFDGCLAAAVAARQLCADVYVHPTLLEVHCPARAARAAVSLLAEHVAVDFVDVKAVAQGKNTGGRAIIGTGPEAASPSASRVLSEIDASGSVIAVADSGIDMNNCFFWDASASPPWANSRVVQSYAVQPCAFCGRCCGALQGPNCTNELNACGNFVDQAGHGTHVAGTVAGAGPASVSYGDGIARGAKIFFQDIENILPESQCYAPEMCGKKNSPPTDLFNLFKPAYDAGVRVHSNSWGPGSGDYSVDAKAVDSFTFSNPTFLILFPAGNDGTSDILGTLGSTSTCKNCLVVGATQQNEVSFRSMSPYVDDGQFCSVLASAPVSDTCCSNPLSCVNRCCPALSLINSSLPCCAKQTTCSGSGSCSVESGNLHSARNVAPFSSRGPTPDGRFKPDLVAPGDDVLSAATPEQIVPGKFTFTSNNHCVVPSDQSQRSAQDHFDRALRLESGTSMAVPLVAGAAEKVRQYFVQGYYPQGWRLSGRAFEPEEALVRAVLLASCVGAFSDKQSWGVWSQYYQFAYGFFRYPIPLEASPNFFQGFGLPVLDHAVYMTGSTNGHRMLFTNGSFSPRSSPAAYKISCDPKVSVLLTLALVWTDPPGSVYSDRQLVNDLDLIVLVPGGVPSQYFGNMRPFADQSNTVERVVTDCPDSGFVSAIVAPGAPPKTASQAWYLVANGPVLSIDSLSPVPAYAAGRAAGPAAQPQTCVLDPGIVASVKFKPSRVWLCQGLIGAWDCSVKKRTVITLLAQALGVAVQGFGKASIDSAGLSVTLHCSVVVGAWQSDKSVSYQYVTAAALQKHIWSSCNAAGSLCGSDPVLSAFDWSTFAVAAIAAPAAPQMSMSITAYDDKDCANQSSSFLSASNPLVFTDQACFPGFLVSGRLFWVKASSCGSNSTFQLSLNVDKACLKDLQISVVSGGCSLIPEVSSVLASATWIRATCSSPPAASCKYPALCLLIPDSAFYAIVALVLLHLVQAVVWAVVAKKRALFSAANFVIVALVPVLGLFKWLPLCRPPESAKQQLKSKRSTGASAERGDTLLQEINTS